MQGNLGNQEEGQPIHTSEEREAQRGFLQEEIQTADEQEKIVTDKEQTSQSAAFPCDQCENHFKTESGLKIHIGKSHKLK